MRRIQWCMQRAAFSPFPWYEHVTIDGDRFLTHAEWDLVVHPPGPWTLRYFWDERAVPPELGVHQGGLAVRGSLVFRASASLRDVLGAIAALPLRCGYFQGFEQTGDTEWALCWVA